MNNNVKKIVAGTVAVCAAAAMLVTGTYALQNNLNSTLHKAADTPAVLNNSFAPPEMWALSDPPVPSEISVTNPAENTAPVLVRLRFKEFMQGYSIPYANFFCYSHFTPNGEPVPMLFVTYRSGANFGKIASWATKREASSAAAEYGLSYVDIVELDHDADRRTPNRFFLHTGWRKKTDGIFGKPMLKPNVDPYSTPLEEMAFGLQESAEAGQSAEPKGELLHLWEENAAEIPEGKTIADYVRWQLGGRTTPFKSWVTAGTPAGNQWVLADDGWCYWVNALLPGETTENVLESIGLLEVPGDTFKYEIYTDMQTVTPEEAPAKWGQDMPEALKKTLPAIENSAILRQELLAAIQKTEGEHPKKSTEAKLEEATAALYSMNTNQEKLEKALAGLPTGE